MGPRAGHVAARRRVVVARSPSAFRRACRSCAEPIQASAEPVRLPPNAFGMLFDRIWSCRASQSLLPVLSAPCQVRQRVLRLSIRVPRGVRRQRGRFCTRSGSHFTQNAEKRPAVSVLCRCFLNLVDDDDVDRHFSRIDLQAQLLGSVFDGVATALEQTQGLRG